MEETYWEPLKTSRTVCLSLSSPHPYVFQSLFPAFSLVLVNLLVTETETSFLLNNHLGSLYSCSLVYFSGDILTSKLLSIWTKFNKSLVVAS